MTKVFRMGPHALHRFRERFPADMSNQDIIDKLNKCVDTGHVMSGTVNSPRGVYFPLCGMVAWATESNDNEDEMFVKTVCTTYGIEKGQKTVHVEWRLLGSDEDEQRTKCTEERAEQTPEALGFC